MVALAVVAGGPIFLPAPLRSAVPVTQLVAVSLPGRLPQLVPFAWRFSHPLKQISASGPVNPKAALAYSLPIDKTPKGTLPQGWSAYMTHSGGAPLWQVIKDPATHGNPRVLAQLSEDATHSRFPLAIYRDASIRDGAISVSFKAISGKVDQGAGLVWRFIDADNYYVARANALEDNVVLYKVEKGVRTPLAPTGTLPGTYGVKHKVAPRVWQRLSVSFHGGISTVSLNGEKLFEVEDGTFAGEGRTGLWTKSDSVIYFRDFNIENDSALPAH